MNVNNLLKVAVFTPLRGFENWGLPVLFVGQPGIAKSAIIEGFAAAHGLPCEVLSPGERGEGAFGCVPVPTAEGYLAYPQPEWAREMNEHKRGLVFVDELMTATRSLQAPLLGLVSARRIGGKRLAPGVRVVGAGNPPHLSANGFDLAPPLANRFIWLPWEPPAVSAHVDYMAGEFMNSSAPSIEACEDIERDVLLKWPTAFSKAAGYEAGFLNRNHSHKNRMPKGEEEQGGPWPSDRTWEMATRAFASSMVHGLSTEETQALIRGAVGLETSEAFLQYITTMGDLPETLDFVSRKATFKHRASRLDLTVALLTSATAFVTSVSDKKVALEYSRPIWELINSVSEESRDVTVDVAQMLTRARLIPPGVSMKVLAGLQPIVSAINAAR